MDVLNDVPIARLTHVLERLVRQLRSVSANGVLSSAAASTLFRLIESGPQRITDLAHGEGVSQPAMTQLVDRLVKEGLAVRTAADLDRRAVQVAVTDRGCAAVEERRAARVAWLEDVLTTLSPDERRSLTAALPALEQLVASRPDTTP